MSIATKVQRLLRETSAADDWFGKLSADKQREYLKSHPNSKQFVHRLDANHIQDFSKKMNTYHHTSDWTQSGRVKPEAKPPKGMHKSTGLFAGEKHAVSPYAVPRKTPWIQHHDKDGNSHVTFEHKDKAAIKAHRPTLSTFHKSDFKHIPASGEHFSKGTPKLINQQKIHPLSFMKESGHNVHFVPSLKVHKANLIKTRTNFDSEGI